MASLSSSASSSSASSSTMGKGAAASAGAALSSSSPVASDYRAFLKAQALFMANQTCFDCGAPTPTSADMDYGVYLCSTCCTLHHVVLGSAPARAKSFETAPWTEEDLLALQFGGNAKGREYFERSGEPHQARDEFQIKTKYASQAAKLYKKMLAVDVQLGTERGTVLEVMQDEGASSASHGSSSSSSSPSSAAGAGSPAKLMNNPKYQDNDMEGELLIFQKGGTLRRMKWSTRYFVLKGGQLHCFKTTKDKKALMSLASSHYAVGALKNNMQQKHAFELSPITGREMGLLLAAASAADMQTWITRLIQKGMCTLKDDAVDMDLSFGAGLFRRAIVDTTRRDSLRASRAARPQQVRESVAHLFQSMAVTPSDMATVITNNVVTLSRASPNPTPHRRTPVPKQQARKEDSICHACDTPILDDTAVTAFGRHYHDRHFCCEECKETFKEVYYAKDDKPYCLLDYNNLFVPMCGTCQELIIDAPLIQTASRFFHSEHFTCKECGKQFADKQTYFTRDGKVYCEPDYLALFCPRCNTCNLRIRDPTYVTMGDEHHHHKCVVCKVCSKQLGTDKEPAHKTADGSFQCTEHFTPGTPISP